MPRRPKQRGAQRKKSQMQSCTATTHTKHELPASCFLLSFSKDLQLHLFHHYLTLEDRIFVSLTNQSFYAIMLDSKITLHLREQNGEEKNLIVPFQEGINFLNSYRKKEKWLGAVNENWENHSLFYRIFYGMTNAGLLGFISSMLLSSLYAGLTLTERQTDRMQGLDPSVTLLLCCTMGGAGLTLLIHRLKAREFRWNQQDLCKGFKGCFASLPVYWVIQTYFEEGLLFVKYVNTAEQPLYNATEQILEATALGTIAFSTVGFFARKVDEEKREIAKRNLAMLDILEESILNGKIILGANAR